MDYDYVCSVHPSELKLQRSQDLEECRLMQGRLLHPSVIAVFQGPCASLACRLLVLYMTIGFISAL